MNKDHNRYCQRCQKWLDNASDYTVHKYGGTYMDETTEIICNTCQEKINRDKISGKCSACPQPRGEQYYSLNKAGSISKVCLACWNQNQERYKQDCEIIDEIYTECHGDDSSNPVSSSQSTRLKQKCLKCGKSFLTDGSEPEMWRHTGSYCWEKDRCLCGNHEELGENLLLKDCPNRYSRDNLPHRITEEDIKKLQAADPNWDVKNNKQVSKRERERERAIHNLTQITQNYNKFGSIFKITTLNPLNFLIMS